MSKRNEKLRFVVVGIRHFINGEHHWMVAREEDAEAFAENGKVVRNTDRLVDTPAFTSLKDAENYAMSIVHDEMTLAQWEERRPTMYILEESQFVALVEKEDYAWPEGSDEWSDAKAADFERECDCQDIINLALWDSDSDEEKGSEKVLKTIDGINRTMDDVTAWLEDGLVAMHYEGKQNKECCADFIEGLGGFPKGSLEWVKSDEGNGVAYYEVK